MTPTIGLRVSQPIVPIVCNLGCRDVGGESRYH